MKKYKEKHDKAVETFKTITGETVETREGAVKALAWIMKNKSYTQAAEAIMAATRYLPDGLVDYIPLPDDDGDELPVDERYAEALALYTAGLAYRNDATDTVNAERSAACLARAEALMI